MKNLAGDPQADAQIRAELELAKVPLVNIPLGRTEVPYTLIGKLVHSTGAEIVFRRAWYYWVATGNVQLNIARELYGPDAVRAAIRVEGNCESPSPEDWAVPIVASLSQADLQKCRNLSINEVVQLCKSGKITSTRYVGVYHIDTQEALDLFVKVLKKHGYR